MKHPVLRALCAVVTITLAAKPAAQAQTRTPVGAWLTEDGGGVIAIAERGSLLYGRIVGLLRLSQGEPPPLDHQGRPRCGLEIVHGLKEDPPGEWFGKITNPEDGRTWDVRITLDDAGNLRLRGFLLISLLGATQVWTPYHGRLGPDCRPVP